MVAILSDMAKKAIDSHCRLCGRPVDQMSSMYWRGDGSIECGVLTECYGRDKRLREANSFSEAKGDGGNE